MQTKLTWGVLLREGKGEGREKGNAELPQGKRKRERKKEQKEEEEEVGRVPPFKGVTHTLPGPQGVGPGVPGC